MKKPIYQRDFFWIVALPTVLVAVAFALALIIKVLT
jgi:hypothetical protein